VSLAFALPAATVVALFALIIVLVVVRGRR
jgi:hypothetical protein